MADYFLGEVLLYRGRFNEAASLFEKVLSAQRKIYGPANSVLIDTIASLAQARVAQNEVREAERLIRETLDVHDASNQYVRIGGLQALLAMIVMKQGRFAEAERLLRDTLGLFARQLPADHQYIASAEHYLGEALLRQRKYSDAEPVLVGAMERWRRSEAPAWRSAHSASMLGELLHRRGRMREAEDLLVDSFRRLSVDPRADKQSKQAARERLTRLYTDLGQPQKLDALLTEEAQSGTSIAGAPVRRRTSVAKVELDSSTAR